MDTVFGILTYLKISAVDPQFSIDKQSIIDLLSKVTATQKKSGQLVK